MPYIETIDEIVEEIADLIGVYGGHDQEEKTPCRICFTEKLADRMKKAVENEKTLSRRLE